MRGQPTDSNYADFQWYFNCKPVALVFCSLQDQLLDQSGVWKKINCSWCWNLGKSSGRAGRFENSLRAPHSKAQRQELTLPCPVSFTPGGLWLCQDQSVLPGYCAVIAGTQPWWKGVMLLPSLTVDHIPVLHHMLMPHFLLRFQFLSWEKKNHLSRHILTLTSGQLCCFSLPSWFSPTWPSPFLHSTQAETLEGLMVKMYLKSLRKSELLVFLGSAKYLRINIHAKI